MSKQPSREISDSYTKPSLDPRIRRDSKKVLQGILPEHTLAAPQRFADFDRPVMLAWAANDRLFPLELRDRLAKVLTHARSETITDCRTFVPEDQPDELARLIASFIDQNALLDQ